MEIWVKQYPRSYRRRAALEFLMPVERLKEYLDKEDVRYVTIKHSKAYKAQEIAAIAHIPNQEIAKAVMLKIDGEMAMMVVPASSRVDLERLKEVVRSENVELAPEGEFKNEFPDCEVGAMPPFGNLYGMKVLVSQALTEDDEIAFNAGSHTELIRLAYQDFERLVQPILIPL
jgi:Ala-tRNA(Pro) deacylase